jgi:hypothetical protein
MAEGSTRSGSGFGPVVLAMIFLAVLGGGAGYSLGTYAKDHPSGGVSSDTDTGSGDQTTTATDGGGSGGGGSDAPPTRCPKHTETLAAAGPLTRVLYLHTAQSEVWICKDSAGTLYYQGHRGAPGEDLQENINALYLTQVAPEGDGYVATNADGNGTTEYHVTSGRLVVKYKNFHSPRPNDTQTAVP